MGFKEELAKYYDEIGISNTISWNERIQYIDFNILPATRKVIFKAFLNGEYKSIATDRPNSVELKRLIQIE
jgi:hypothetical protein